MTTAADSVGSPVGDQPVPLPPFPGTDTATPLPSLSAEQLATALYGYQKPPPQERPIPLPPITQPTKTIADQQEVLQPPRDIGFADRLGAAIREAASPLIGQTPVQAAQAETAQQRLLPEFRGGRSLAQVQAETYSPQGDVLPDRTKAPLTSSFYRGGRQLEDTGLALAQWLATMAGIETPAIDAQKAYNAQKISENPPLIHGPDEVRNLSDALTYALEQVGQNAPTAAPGMVGGFGAGQIAARTAGKIGAEALANRVAAGQAIGATGGSIAQEVGSIFSDATQDNPADRNRLTALLSLAHGIPAGLLDAVGEKLALGRLPGGHEVASGPLENFLSSKGSRSFFVNGVARLGDAGLEQFVTQAPTEYFQTLIEQSGKASSDLLGQDKFWAQYFDQLTSPEAQSERAQAALGGAISGVATGVAFQLPGVVGKIADGRAAERAVSNIRQELDRQASQPKPETAGTPTQFQTAPASATLPVASAQSGLTAEQSTFGTVTPVDQVILRNRFDQAVAADQARAAQPVAPAGPQIETAPPTALPDFSQGAPAIMSLLDHPVEQLQRTADQQEAQTPAPPSAPPLPGSIEYQAAIRQARQNAQTATPATDQPAVVPNIPPARPVAQAVSQGPQAAIPAAPSPAPVRQNQVKQQVANDQASTVRAEQSPAVATDTEAAVTYFQQNPQHAQAVADYMAVGDYRAAVDRAVESLPETGGDGDSFVRQQLQDRLFQYVVRKKDQAFSQKGDRPTLKTGPGGFPLKQEISRAVKDFLRSEPAQNITAENKVNLTADVTEGRRSAAETLAAKESRPVLTDELKIRDRLLQGLTAGSVEQLGHDVVAQNVIGRMTGGGTVNLTTAGTDTVPWQAVSKWVATNERSVQQKLHKIITQLQADHDVSYISQSLIAAYANALTGTGRGMTIDQVRQAVTSTFGRLPPNVLIVNDRTLASRTGEPLKGMYVGGLTDRIVLNAANLNNPLDATIALLHETLHRAWDLPAVQTAVTRLMEAVSGRIQGYDPATVREELAVRGATDQWQSDQQRTLWNKLVDTVWSAVRKIFGAEPTLVELRRQLVARAIRSINGETVTPRGVIRYYNGFQIQKQEDLAQALSAPNLSTEQQTGITQVAGAVNQTVPPAVAQQLDQWAKHKLQPLPAGLTPAQRQAIVASNSTLRTERTVSQMLRPVLDISRLQVQPVEISGVQIGARDIAANVVLETANRIETLRHSLEAELPQVQQQLKDATDKKGQVTLLTAQADMANGLAADLLEAAEESIDAQSRLGPSIPAAQRQAVDQLKLQLGLLQKRAPTSVGPALQWVADHRPIGADPVQWLLQQRTAGWPANPGGTAPMSPLVFDYLASGWKPALNNRTAEIDRLTQLAADKEWARQVISDTADFYRSLGHAVKSAVTARQFAEAYGKWKAQAKGLIDQVREYNGEVRRATDRMDAIQLAIQKMDEIQTSPEYKDQWAQATNQLDARQKSNLEGGAITDFSQENGDWIVRSPLTGEQLRLQHGWNEQAIQNNADLAERLIKEINDWQATGPNNPPLENMYGRLRAELQAVWTGSIVTMNLTGMVTPVYFTKEFSMSLPANLTLFAATGVAKVARGALRAISSVTGQMVGRDLIYSTVGGVAGRMLVRYMTRPDHVRNAINAARDHSRYGAHAIDQSLYQGAVRHGLTRGLTNGQAAARYNDNVVNFVLRNGQYIGKAATRVGDITPTGETITQADIDAAWKHKHYHDAIHNSAKASQGGVMEFAPFLTNTEKWFRRALDWGMMMQRRVGHWGGQFITEWEVARKADREAVGPGARANAIQLLESNPNHFTQAVNGMAESVGNEYQLTDKVQQQALADRYALPPASRLFHNMEDFRSWMADRREAIINANLLPGQPATSQAEQRVEAERILVDDLDRATRLLGDQNSNGAESDSRVMGVGQPSVSSLTGSSSFTRPRGNQVAPNTFYDYTLGQEADRLRYNASAMRYYQKMEIDALGSVIKSMELERQRQEKLWEDFQTARAASPLGPIDRLLSGRRQFKIEQYRAVKAGQSLTTLQAITTVLNDLRAVDRGMRSAMASADIEDNQLVRVLSQFEVITSLIKLASLPVQFTNQLGASQIGPLLSDFARARGKFGIFNSLAVMSRQFGQVAASYYRTAIHLALGHEWSPMKNLLTAHPGVFVGLASHLTRQIMQRQADIDFLANQAGTHPPPTFKEAAGRLWFQVTTLSKTSGRVTDRPTNAFEALTNWVLFPGALNKLLASYFHSNVDAMGLRTQVAITQSTLAGIRGAVIRAYQMRESAGVPLGQPLTYQELQENGQTGMAYLRDIFSPAGRLEPVFEDFYTRYKAATDKDSVPLLRPGVDRDVVTRILSHGNIINDSGKGEGAKGKGMKGMVKTAASRFSSFPIHFTAILPQAAYRDARDHGQLSKEAYHLATALGFMAIMVALSAVNLTGSQWSRELMTGKVPSTPTAVNLLSSGQPLDFAKVFYLGGTSLMLPIYSDYISSAISGQQQRNPFDLTSMIPGAGALASVGKMITQVAQSGDLYYPTVGFLKSQSPLFEAVYNRTAGAAELDQLNAARAFRSAAPSDISIRQPDGGTVRLTTQSPDIRDALRAAATGDQQAFNKAVDSAVAKVVAAGGSPLTARKKILQSIQARSPERSVFGRTLLPDEMVRVEARMTGSQLAAVRAVREISARIDSWTGAKHKAPTGKRLAGGSATGLTARLGPSLPRLRPPKQLRPKLAAAR